MFQRRGPPPPPRSAPGIWVTPGGSRDLTPGIHVTLLLDHRRPHTQPSCSVSEIGIFFTYIPVTFLSTCQNYVKFLAASFTHKHNSTRTHNTASSSCWYDKYKYMYNTTGTESNLSFPFRTANHPFRQISRFTISRTGQVPDLVKGKTQLGELQNL